MSIYKVTFFRPSEQFVEAIKTIAKQQGAKIRLSTRHIKNIHTEILRYSEGIDARIRVTCLSIMIPDDDDTISEYRGKCAMEDILPMLTNPSDFFASHPDLSMFSHMRPQEKIS
jgi:hypothetical protein